MTTTESTPEDESAGESDRSDTDGRAVAGGQPPTRVPEGAEPQVCPYCGFELPADDQYRLHLGLNHYEQLDDGDQAAFRETYQQEEESLTRFRIIALGGLVGLYFGFLLIYAVLAT
ncbi:hypothetical protein [Halonotius roseus]|uniref:C2H2-type domain-containing protein n=1 Tax=Halonotius roseus TaxID=2511997 RepID=A0A544QLM2_9EURY|nr:hypothetical protein [Halonotius roseus]TQQ79495.1 hypothetical protein EWF95_10785 [Halonotius roseus]